ncbi:imidazole glycerol phosphate synthase subunit HisH [Aquirufa sp. Wall-65K1]
MSSINKIAIIDYGIGNLYSVKKACEYVGLDPIITDNRDQIANSEALILPGVGAYGNAIKNLQDKDLVDCIHKFSQSGKYIMGICLGMQLLMDYSEEFGIQNGLGLIEGGCKKFNFNDDTKVPQINWNRIYISENEEDRFDVNSSLSSINNGAYMYFVHSFYVDPTDKGHILSKTSYSNFEYCSSVKKDNIFGFQFHPEKSGVEGLDIYNNFKKLIKK